ncbi:hypothetical protein Tco_1539135 [Tanacetum coccineum]
MAEEQDKQQQQQNLLDAKLVPINEQVKISTRNFRIALEKTQPNVIYKVCLEILMQYSFYNAFITTADTPHIYMQKFWYTITYDLTAKAFFFTMTSIVLGNGHRTVMLTVLSHLEEFQLPDSVKERKQTKVELCLSQVSLRNLKFINKGSKEPIFGMAIPVVMLNDDIKASVEYSKVSILRRRRSKIVTKEVGQSEGIDDDEVDSKETEEDEEPLELKGLETLSKVAQFQLNMIRARKASRHDFFIQQRQRGLVPDEPSDYSSSSSSASEFGVEEISSDEAEVIEKNNNAKIIDAKKDTKYQVAEEQGAEKHLGNEELEMPDAPLISSSQTLSFAEFTSQFLNDNSQITVYDVLKDSIEPGVQSMVDNPVTQEKPTEPRPPLVDTTITLIPDQQQFLPRNWISPLILKLTYRTFSDDVPNFGKIKLEKAKKSMPKNSSTLVDQAALDEFKEKD